MNVGNKKTTPNVQRQQEKTVGEIVGMFFVLICSIVGIVWGILFMINVEQTLFSQSRERSPLHSLSPSYYTIEIGHKHEGGKIFILRHDPLTEQEGGLRFIPAPLDQEGGTRGHYNYIWMRDWVDQFR